MSPAGHVRHSGENDEDDDDGEEEDGDDDDDEVEEEPRWQGHVSHQGDSCHNVRGDGHNRMTMTRS